MSGFAQSVLETCGAKYDSVTREYIDNQDSKTSQEKVRNAAKEWENCIISNPMPEISFTALKNEYFNTDS